VLESVMILLQWKREFFFWGLWAWNRR